MVDPEKFVVRKYVSGDEEAIVELLELVFEGWPNVDLPCSKVDHWKWKYLDRPMHETIAAITLYEGKIVGCLHSPYTHLQIGENVYLSEQGGDLAVHPDFRGLKVWRTMTNTWINNNWSGNVVGYNNSSHPTVVQRSKANNSLGWPSGIKHYARIRDIDSFIDAKNVKDSMVKKMGYLGLTGLSKIRNIGKIKPQSHVSISTISEFDDRIDLFWDKINGEYDLVVERRKEYLNWRYCDPRGGEFTVRLAEDDDEVVGYSVLRTNRINPKNPEGYIIDLMTSKSRKDVAERLVEDACSFFDGLGVNAVHYWAPQDHFIVRIIDKHSFLDSFTEVYVWFGNRGDPEIKKRIKTIAKDRVYFQLGDVDWI